jgi:hypothetical protein
LTGQVEICRPSHVDAAAVLEDPELRAQPGVEVEEAKPAVSGVTSQVEVQHAAVGKVTQ